MVQACALALLFFGCTDFNETSGNIWVGQVHTSLLFVPTADVDYEISVGDTPTRPTAYFDSAIAEYFWKAGTLNYPIHQPRIAAMTFGDLIPLTTTFVAGRALGPSGRTFDSGVAVTAGNEEQFYSFGWRFLLVTGMRLPAMEILASYGNRPINHRICTAIACVSWAEAIRSGLIQCVNDSAGGEVILPPAACDDVLLRPATRLQHFIHEMRATGSPFSTFELEYGLQEAPLP